MAYSGLSGKIFPRPRSGVEKMVGLGERIGEVPGSGPQTAMGPGTDTWLKSWVEIGTPVGTGAGSWKAVEVLLPAFVTGWLSGFHQIRKKEMAVWKRPQRPRQRSPGICCAQRGDPRKAG